MKSKRSLGMLPKWDDYKWDDFVNDERAKINIDHYLRDPKKALDKKAGLFIFGNPGVGKSLLANLMARSLDSSHTVRIISTTGLVNLVTASWEDKDKRKEYDLIIQHYDFLIVEDFGKEFVRKDSDNKSFLTSVLEDTLSKRNIFGKATSLISSITASQVKKQYSANLASLVLEICVPLKVDGTDYRRKIQNDLKKVFRIPEDQDKN